MKKLNSLEEEMFVAEHKFNKGAEIGDFAYLSTSTDKVGSHVLIDPPASTEINSSDDPPDGMKIPATQFEENALIERDRDFLLSNLHDCGFLLSENAKKVFDKYDLGKHKYYQVDIVLEKGGFFKRSKKLRYFWLHVAPDYKLVDFPSSVFREQVKLDGKLIEINEKTFNSLEDRIKYNKEKHDVWLSDSENNPYYDLVHWTWKLKDRSKIPDLFLFGAVDYGSIYASKKMAEDIQASGLKGLNISGTRKIASQ